MKNYINTLRKLSPKLAIFFAVLLFIFSAITGPVAAISQNDLNSILNGTPFYDPNSPWCVNGANSNTGPITLVGNDNLQQIFNYFSSNGYTAPQAAGIVGNIEVESHGDPEIWEGNGKDYQVPPQPSSTSLGWGIVQWTPANKILNFAQTVNQPAYSLSTQIEFLSEQLNGTAPNNNEQPAGNALKQATTAFGAAVAFMQYYERPQNDSATGTNAQIRGELANQALALYGGASTQSSQSTTSTTSATTTNCSGGVGGGGSITGCNFGTSTGPFTTDTSVVYPGVQQMCGRVSQLVNSGSPLFHQWCGAQGSNLCYGLCEGTVAFAWQFASYASAIAEYNASVNTSSFHPKGTSPPVGAILLYYYEPYSVFGHAAIYLGNNMAMSTDIGGNGYVWITTVTKLNAWAGDNVGYLGWSDPGHPPSANF